MTMFDLLLVFLALVLGFAVSRARLCAVACVQRLILDGKVDGLIGLAMAASASGIVLLVLALLLPDYVMLPVDQGASAQAIVGGIALGMGALINGGCYLGSITYLGTGNANFLFTLIGVAAGLRLAEERLHVFAAPAATMTIEASAAWIAGIVVFAMILLAGWRADLNSRSRHSWSLRGSWQPGVAAAVVGAIAALVFARHPNWSYGTVLDDLAHADQHPLNWMANAAALALFTGAVVGSLLAGKWSPARPSVSRSSRCLAGGALMGYGATLVPGGNDTLLLWAIPGITAYGLLAFATMLLTIGIVFLAGRYKRRKLANR